MLTAYLGLPRQSEILIIIFLGICFLSLDFSLFQLRSNLQEIWKIELLKLKPIERCVKYLIAAVVLVRTFTLHAFLACYVVMLWPAIFEENPNLMLPWLLLGIVRCLILNGITLILGTLICYIEKGFSPICFEYILAQIIEHGPSVYAWMSILSFYRELALEQGFSASSSNSSCSDTSTPSQSSNKSSQSSDLDKVKSYSFSDLNLDYMCSSLTKNLSGEMPIEFLIAELKDVFDKRRISPNGSKSFDSLIHREVSECLENASSLYVSNFTIRERRMRDLGVSEEDILMVQQDKDRFARFLKEISVNDINEISNLPSRSFSSNKNKLRTIPKRHLLKSLSESKDSKTHVTCFCYLKKQLQQSNQTLLESEIANITFNDADKDIDNGSKTCYAFKWKFSAKTIQTDLN